MVESLWVDICNSQCKQMTEINGSPVQKTRYNCQNLEGNALLGISWAKY